MAGQDPLDIGITGLEFYQTSQGLFLLTTSGVNGGLSSYQLSGFGSAQLVDMSIFSPGMSNTASGGISLIEIGSVTYALTGGSSATRMDGYQLGTNGDIGSTGALIGIGTAQGGGASVMTAMTLAAHDMLYFAELGGSGISAYRIDSQAQYDAAASVADTGQSYANNVVALRQTVVDGQTYLIAASASESGVSTYLVDPVSGALELRGAMGAQNGLGVNNPTGMEVVTAFGNSYVILASAGSNSLSVMQVMPGGGLMTVDHVIDTLNTRFGNVATLETFTIDGRVYVLAGGGDDGVSLFTLLPDGHLLHLETLVDSMSLGLNNVAEIAAHRIGQEVQIFVTSQNEGGLTQFSLDTSQQGEQILGTNENNTLGGNGGDDLLSGGRGDDVLRGNGGDDILLDGAGQDRLYGGAGADIFVLSADNQLDWIMDFQAGVDRLDISSFQMLYSLGQLGFSTTSYGARIVYRGEVIEVHNQAGGGLTLLDIFGRGFGGPDRPPLMVGQEMFGSSGNDQLAGAEMADIIHGLGGDDILWGHRGDDQLSGGDGRDQLYGGVGQDRLSGGAGDDWLFGQENDDFLYGDGGNDNLRGGAGDDWLYGQNGSDNLRGGSGADWLMGGNNNDLLYGGDGYDNLRGDAGNDALYGDAGNDDLRGGLGADWVLGGFGDDLIYGGAGSDNLRGDAGGDTMHGDAGHDNMRGGRGNDTLYGGAGDDGLWGNEGNDWLLGGSGDDLIYGGNGYDNLRGDAGDDALYGQDGNDILQGGLGNDTLNGGAGNDILSGEAGNDVLFGLTGDDTLTGSSGNDWLLGGYGDDRIYGGDDNDKLRGLSGNDLLYGEAGQDHMLGGWGNDALYGGDGNDGLWGEQGVDWLLGGDGNDLLYGGRGNDYLLGGDGNDLLIGGTGDDRLSGDGGADSFIFIIGGGSDRVTDYEVGVDYLRFDDALWENTPRTSTQIMQFAAVQNGSVLFDFGSGNTVLLEGVNSLSGLESMIWFF